MNYSEMASDELMHYGVIGMKWGIRRADKRGTNYTYKSHGQKKYEKKMAKLEAKGSKAKPRKVRVTQNKLKTYQKRDTNRQKYTDATSVGKSVAKTIVFGPLGSGNYNRFRASGHGRIVSALGSNYVAASIGYPLTLVISRNSELKSARN